MRTVAKLSLLAAGLCLAGAAAAGEPKKKTSLRAKVVSVSKDGKTVKLAAGSKQGVAEKLPFLVRRGFEDVAWLKVTAVKEGSATAELTGGGGVRAGDVAVQAFQMGKVIWYRPERRLEVRGRICLQEGPLEYLAVLKGGKEYESVMAFDCSAIDVNLGLILSGYKRVRGSVKKVGDPDVPKGDPLYLHVEWVEEREGKQVVKRVRAEDLLWNQITKKPMRRSAWVFSGSRFVKDPEDPKKRYFLAQVERKLVAVFRDPGAIFNCPLDTGDEDVFYVVNKKVVPKSTEWTCPKHADTAFKKDGECSRIVERDGKREKCGLKLRPLGREVRLIMAPAPMSALKPENLKDGRDLFKSTGEENPPGYKPVPVPKSKDGDGKKPGEKK